MIVRRIRPEEIKRVNELFSVAFCSPIEEDGRDPVSVYNDMLKNPRSREDVDPLSKYAAFEDDDKRMFSCLFATSFPMYFDGKKTDMTGVGGVSTLPEARRRGGIRACFELMLNDAYKEGKIFSCLYPFSTAYYAKFGYGISMASRKYELLTEFIPKSFETGGHCVLIDSSNKDELFEDVKNVYTGFAKERNGMIVNDDFEYSFVLKADPYKTAEYTYLYYEQNEPLGYVTFKRISENGNLIISCRRFIYKNINAVKGMLTLIKTMQSDCRLVRFALPSDTAFERLVPERSFGALSISETFLGMIRAVNVKRVLELSKYRGSGKITFTVIDPVIEENTGEYTVTFENGTATSVVRAKAEDKENTEYGTAVFSINRFSELCLGVTEPEDLEGCDGIVLENCSSEYKTELAKVFYRKKCFINEYF